MPRLTRHVTKSKERVTPAKTTCPLSSYLCRAVVSQGCPGIRSFERVESLCATEYKLHKNIKMDFKRIGLMTIAAGLAITSFNACSQDEDLEGYVLNEGNGVSTLAKRSMGRGGESTEPVAPSRKHDEEKVTFHYVPGTANDEDEIHYDGIVIFVGYSYIFRNHTPSDVRLEYFYAEGSEDTFDFDIEEVQLVESLGYGHYDLVCSAVDRSNYVQYSGKAEVSLSE